MKKIVLFFTVAAITTSLYAQQNRGNKEQSLFEKVSKIEKKSDRFNLFLNMNGSFDTEFLNGDFQGAKFNMRQLRIEAKGNINEWLSYRWRQRLNRPNNSNGSIDNTPTSIDIAGIGVKITDKFSIFAGKQCAAYGGIEFDLNPIEIYEYCDMIENMSNFMMGLNFAYEISPNHQIQFQVLNGLNHKFEYTYTVDPKEITASKVPLLYTLNWNGSLFDGILNTRWSASLMSQATDKNMYYFAFGNQVNISKKLDFYIDAMYSNEGIDRKGIISGILNNDLSATDVSYLSFLTKINFRFAPKWNFFVKGMYETASLSNDNHTFEKGKYRTSFGYFAGLEYYPMEQSNLHFFLTYVGRKFNFEDRAKLDNLSTNRISLGLIYQLPMY